MEEELRPFAVVVTMTEGGHSVKWTSMLTKNQTINMEVSDRGTLMIVDPGSNRITMVAEGFWSFAEVYSIEEED